MQPETGIGVGVGVRVAGTGVDVVAAVGDGVLVESFASDL
jgi:hypothetical protein